MAELTYYYSEGSCSLGTRVMLHECDVEFKDNRVNPETKMTEDGEDYTKSNPKGKVPGLRVGEKFLTESQAILQFIADLSHRTDLLPDVEDIDRYKVLEAFSFLTSDLFANVAMLLNPMIPDDVKEQFARSRMMDNFNILNHGLEEHEYLALEHFTIADAYFAPFMAILPEHVGLDLHKFPALEAYAHTLLSRESVLAALKEEYPAYFASMASIPRA